MKKEIYQHFRPEEYDFIEKMDDIAQRVEETYAYSLTDFLNPRQVDIAKSILGNRGLHYFVSSSGRKKFSQLQSSHTSLLL